MHSLHPTLDFTDYVRRRTEHFVGRGWVFDRVGEWLTGSVDPLFLITGGPGTGKSAFAARLAQVSTGEAPSPHPALREGFLTLAQFCQESSDPTLDPRELVLSLSLALANRHPLFAERLAAQGAATVILRGEVEVAGALAGTATGLSIGTLNVGEMSARVAFNRLLRRPLEEARDFGMADPVVILLDGLDESLPYARSENIVRLLEQILDDLPPGVRVVATSRPDERVLTRIGPPDLDLLNDAPGDDDDLGAYLREALADQHGGGPDLAGAIAEAAEGNFLYARHMAEALRAGTSDPSAPGWVLPSSLRDIYRDFCDRRIEVDGELWSRTFRPLLSALAVAQEPGLLRSHLRRVAGGSRAEVDDALHTLSQFLVADGDGGPFGLYHTSFRDFLLEERVEAPEANEQLARLFLEAHEGAWDICTDPYALAWTPHHLERAVDGEDPLRDHRLTTELVGLVTDPAYQKQVITRTEEVATLRRAVSRAVAVAAVDPRPGASLLVAKAALAAHRFEAEHLRPESLFRLAREGELERALDRFDLFSCDDAWRKAARLALIWIGGGGVDPTPRVQAILDEIEAGEAEDELKQWARRITGRSFELRPLPEPPPPEVVEAILERRGGNTDAEGVADVLSRPNAEMLMISGLAGFGDEAPLYLAEADAPVLVAAALEDPPAFTPRLLDYVSLHAENRYVYYRNRSLWIVLLATLRSPEDAWVQEVVESLCHAALAGGGLDFPEALAAAIEARRGGDASSLRDTVDRVRDRAEAGMRDPWSHDLASLGAVSELARLLVDDPATVDDAFELAPRLNPGYAGFRAPALCALAASAEVAGRGSDEVDQILEGALDSAQNIQDPYFCLETTSRVNALRLRWYPLPGPVEQVVAAFLDPEAPSPPQVHIVGEEFPRRQQGPQKVDLGDAVLQARSLADLAQLFWKTANELLDANPALTGDPASPLPEGTEVNVPDVDFRPWVAARLSAAVVSDAALSPGAKARWIRRLVPAAHPDPIALDAVLARLFTVIDVDPDVADEALGELLRSHRDRPPG